jgi:ribonuclease P protein component
MTGIRSLRNSRDFARVFRTGRRASSDGVTVYVATSPDGGAARLGLAIKRGSGNAVARNRTKRRLRAAWGRLDLTEPMDVVIRADRSAVEERYQEMEKHLVSALRSSGALR